MFKQFLESKNYVQYLYLFSLILTATHVIECKNDGRKIPDYIQLCKKDDPELNKCILNIFKSLRPKLGEGVPQIDLPPLDPLLLHEIVIFPGGNGKIKIIAHDVKVTGAKNIEITKIKVNIEKLEIDVHVKFPILHFEGTYDVNAKFLQFVIKGKGPVRGNATEVDADSVIKGKFVVKDGDRFVEFHSAKVDVNLKGYRIKIEKAVPNVDLNNEINNILNDPKVIPIESMKPMMNKISSIMLLKMINKVSRHLSFDEIFN